MKISKKDTFEKRLTISLELANYLSNNHEFFDLNVFNQGTCADDLLESTANYLYSLTKYIMDTCYGCYGGSYLLSFKDAASVKKSILDTVTKLTGCALAFGYGLDKDKYIQIINTIFEDLEPDMFLE